MADYRLNFTTVEINAESNQSVLTSSASSSSINPAGNVYSYNAVLQKWSFETRKDATQIRLFNMWINEVVYESDVFTVNYSAALYKKTDAIWSCSATILVLYETQE